MPSLFPLITSDQDAYVAALAYAGLFNGCLTQDQLQQLAVAHPVTTPPQDSRLLTQDGFSCLQDQAHLLAQAAHAQAIQQQKIAHAQHWLWLFKLLPWIQLVAITGSVAGGNPTPDDDIDILIITQPNRLWLSRLSLTLLLNLFAKRRKPTHQPHQLKDKFCLNMWLTTHKLTEPQQNIYTANELARLIPLLNRHQTYQHYLTSNSWLTQYLPNFPTHKPTPSASRFPPPASRFISRLDTLCHKLLLRIMRHPTQETVEDNLLKFHPHDHTAHVLDRYEQKLKSLGLAKGS